MTTYLLTGSSSNNTLARWFIDDDSLAHWLFDDDSLAHWFVDDYQTNDEFVVADVESGVVHADVSDGHRVDALLRPRELVLLEGNGRIERLLAERKVFTAGTSPNGRLLLTLAVELHISADWERGRSGRRSGIGDR